MKYFYGNEGQFECYMCVVVILDRVGNLQHGAR